MNMRLYSSALPIFTFLGLIQGIMMMDAQSMVNQQISPNKQQESPEEKPKEYDSHNREVGHENNEPSRLEEGCKKDIDDHCNHIVPVGRNRGRKELDIIECLMDVSEVEETALEQKCQHRIWEFKLNVTTDARVHRGAQFFCKRTIEKYPDCMEEQTSESGHMLSCLLEYKEKMDPARRCYKYLHKIEKVAFSDFRLVTGFVEHCRDDIAKHECGSQTAKVAEGATVMPHSQGATIQCLEEKILHFNAQGSGDALKAKCRHEILRIAELQSDDFHLNRPLYFACRQDREVLCGKVQSGHGRIYNCLLQQKHDTRMSDKCAKALLVQGILIGRDFKAAHALTEACGREIEAHECEPQKENRKSDDLYLITLLNCLEQAVATSDVLNLVGKQDEEFANQDKELQVGGDCKEQIVLHKKLLMSDGRISPVILNECKEDFKKYCGEKAGKSGGGYSIHCLMDVASSDKAEELDSDCEAALRRLIQVANPAKDYRVDPKLYLDCRQLLDGPCAQHTTSESNVVDCLVNNADSADMNRKCEKTLLQIQYFMSRDFTLDPQLFQACRADAIAVCQAKPEWWLPGAQENDAEKSISILSCLHRNGYNLEDGAHKNKMTNDDFRTTHPQCTRAVEELTKIETQDIRINQRVVKSCKNVMQEFCSEFNGLDDTGMLDCLIQNKQKPEMRPRCRNYVDHYQFLSLQDYYLSRSFIAGCKSDAEKYCSHLGRNKAKLVRCLSKVAFKHRMLQEGPKLKKECFARLRKEYLKLDMTDAEKHPIFEACRMDIEKHECYTEGETILNVIECLRGFNGSQLKAKCAGLLGVHEKIEAVDNRFDQMLQKRCGPEIDNLCLDAEQDKILDCLIGRIKHVEMSNRCRKLVQNRSKKQSNNFLLRRGLAQKCHSTVETLCPSAWKLITQPESENDRLNKEDASSVALYCLRKLMLMNEERKRIPKPCQQEVKKLIMESEINFMHDERFYQKCKMEVHRLCDTEVLDESGGNLGKAKHNALMECIKTNFYQGKIKDKWCRKEMNRRSAESLLNVELDTGLEEACHTDIQHFCYDVTPGNGRIIECLIATAKRRSNALSATCQTMLDKRGKLWSYAKLEDFMNFIPVAKLRNIAQSAIRTREGRLAIFSSVLAFAVFMCCCAFCLSRYTSKSSGYSSGKLR